MNGPHDPRQFGRPHGIRRLAKLICLPLLGITAGLLLLEVVLRFGLGLGDPPLYEVHPTIEYILKPGSYRRFGNRIFVNSAGMRSPERAVQPLAAGESRVLVLGDSIVNGGSLMDDDDLATSILARRLGGTGVASVCNISAGSWGPGNWLAFLHERGTFAARYAVIVLNDGDFTDAPTFAPLGPEHPKKRPPLACWEALTNYLPRYLPILRTPASAPGPTSGWAHAPMDDLAAGIEFLRMSGVAVSAVLVPAEQELAAGPGEGLTAVRMVLERLKVPWVSAERPLRQALQRGEMPFRDGVHLSAHGQALLAESCLEALELSGLGAPPPR
jgi:hypothetical protein